MSPASLRDFLAKQTVDGCVYNINKKRAGRRWKHWRGRVEAACLHPIIGHVLIEALQGRRAALSTVRTDWPKLWMELRENPAMEPPDDFISDADAASPPERRRRGRPSLPAVR
jgi:hypothetical protein